MQADRRTIVNLCSVAALVGGALGAVWGWYWFWVDRDLAHALAGLASLLVFGGGLWGQVVLISVPASGPGHAGDKRAQERQSFVALSGRVLVEMLWLFSTRARAADCPQAASARVKAAALTLGGLVLLATAATFRASGASVWVQAAGDIVLWALALYLAALGVFLPKRTYENDASVRRLLEDVGFGSLLGVRLFALLIAALLVLLLVAAVRLR